MKEGGVRRRVKELWSFSDVEVTGSSATGLSSYGLFENLSQRSRSNSWESTKSDKGDSTTRSDIDIVVCFSDEMQHMLHGEALLIQALADHFTKIKDYVIESTDGEVKFWVIEK